jgi:AbrB family looped-hinge helix DNA binding protein
MKTKVSSKGQIVLPADLREQDHILPGQQFQVERLEAGQYLLKRELAADNSGVVDWLLSRRGLIFDSIANQGINIPRLPEV